MMAKTGVWTLSFLGGLAHPPVACWADCSFQSSTGDDRGKSAVPIRVLREKEQRRWVQRREGREKEGGTE